MLVGVDGVEQFDPGTVADAEVQESLHHIVFLHCRTVAYQIVANLLGCLLRTLLCGSNEWEHHQRQVTLKLTSRLLQLQHLLRGVHAIERLHGLACCLAD